MKKAVVILLSLLVLNLMYNLFFDFRLVKLRNNGGKKHKISSIYYFPNIPWSVINPLKRQFILKSIEGFLDSKKYDEIIEAKCNHNTYINYVCGWKSYSRSRNIILDAIKDVENETHVLVYLEGTENTCVYVFKDNQIIDFY